MVPAERVRRSSHAFACYTSADLEDVWDTLTNAYRTSAYFFDLTLRSTWAVDAAISADHEGAPSPSGRLVCSRPGHRLSYVLQSCPTDPPTYLTWLVRRSAGGTAINLSIDEPETPESVEDAEDTWLPVPATLQQHLRAQGSRRAD